jgi:hypothetical protein
MRRAQARVDRGRRFIDVRRQRPLAFERLDEGAGRLGQP